MYADLRTARSIQDRRLAELRNLAARRRATETIALEPPEPAPARFTFAWFAALLRPRHA